MRNIQVLKIVLSIVGMSLFIAGDTYARAQAAKGSMELPALLSTYLLPSNANYTVLDWKTGAEPNSPIAWKTQGISATPPYLQKQGYSYLRAGSVVVTLKGKPTHTVLGKTVRPGKWEITLLGARSGVDKAEFRMDANAQEFDADIPKILTATHFNLKPVKCSRETEPATFGNVVYQIQAPGKKSAWLVEEWSCGSAGCATTLSLLYSEKDIQSVNCNANL